MNRLPALAMTVALALALAGVLLADAARALAQEPPRFEVRATVDPPAPALGQRVRLEVAVRHDQGLVITAERPRPTSADVELVSTLPEVTEFDPLGSGATTTFVYVLAAYRLGPVQPGSVRVSWLMEDGTTGATTVQPPAFNVVPVRSPGDDQLRPLKPQATVPGAPPAWQGPVLVAVLVAAAVGVIAWAVVLVRRRRRREPEVIDVDVTPEVEARRRLDVLSTPRTADQYQHFYGSISLTVREYLAARFGFPATALTTTELERRMVAQGVGRWQARLVAGLLDRCDHAVYAHVYPNPASADHDLTVAYEIVELSRPRRFEPQEEAVPV